MVGAVTTFTYLVANFPGYQFITGWFGANDQIGDMARFGVAYYLAWASACGAFLATALLLVEGCLARCRSVSVKADAEDKLELIPVTKS